ncbi:MAG TPA: hypothetical protein DCR03_03135 [Gammaproteobacteria bacterium]|jgi:hypothetical protein|nr:hypothetical protein [Gammaproteobacteria bacterium]|tara:strand:- start:387 stop:608 length:222 start_codon:yes stop_codon:yes gene_type:complete
MLDSVTNVFKTVTQMGLALIALGVVLQILFPNALAFINADVAGNLINLVSQFSGAGLIGLISAGIVVYLINNR